MQEHGLKLCQGSFSLDIRINSYSQRLMKHWNRLPRGMVESPSLEVFKKHRAVELRDMVYYGNIGSRRTVGLDDLGGLLQL